MIDKDLLSRFRFFAANAGGIVGQNATTAIALARAERWADDEELETEWMQDDDGDLGDHEYWCHNARSIDRLSAREQRAYNVSSCEHAIEWCRLVRPCADHGTDCKHAETLGSLGGIIDADRNYRRLIRAELALEAMPSEA